MVREGWAIAYRYYSKDYVNEEEIAKREKKGISQGMVNHTFGEKIISFRILEF